MKKISTLAMALLALGSLAMPASAQNIMPKASTNGGTTYTYYLQGAGKTKGYYASKTAGSDNNVLFTNNKSNRLQVKLVASSSNYNIVTTNLDNTKYIGCNNTTLASDTKDKTNGYVRFYDNTGTNAAWKVEKSTSSSPADMTSYYPYYALKPSANANVSWNAFGGVKANPAQIRLHGNTDQGSQWNFIPADVATLSAWADDVKTEIDALTTTASKDAITAAITAAKSATTEDVDAKAEALLSAYTTFYKQVKVAEGKATADARLSETHQDKLGYPTEVAYTNLKATKDSWTDTWSSNSSYDVISNNINSAISTFYSTIKKPEDGKAYTFTVVTKGGAKRYLNYAGETTGYQMVSTTETNNTNYPETAKLICHKLSDDSFVFLNNGGKYLIIPVSDSGASPQGKGYSNTYKQTIGGASKNVAQLTFENITKSGYVSVENTALYGYMALRGYRNGNETAVLIVKDANGNFDKTAAPYYNGTFSSAILVEETTYPNTITFNKADGIDGVENIATFSAPFATIKPEGVKAYTVNDNNGASATLQEVEGNIPANQGVLLTSETGTAVTMVPVAGEEVATITDNKLGNTAGADKTIAEGENAYVLAKSADVVAFYKAKVNTTLKMNKAYLTANAGANAIALNFGQVTGINNAVVNGENAKNAPVFDLTGRRVAKTVKGCLYIQGGKKFIAQ